MLYYIFRISLFVGEKTMQIRNLMDQLIRLTPLEQLAKQYYDALGKELEYSKFILLTRYVKCDVPSLSYISSPAFSAESEKLALHFESQYRKSGLNDDDFMKQDCDIEIEKLLRYVDIPSHHHAFIEMAYVLTGTCYHRIGNSTFEQQQGSLTFIPSHTWHNLRCSPDCLCLTVKVRTETFLGYHIPNMPFFSIPVCFECGNDAFMRDTLLNIYAQQEAESSYHDEIISHLYQALLTYCMQNYRDNIRFVHDGNHVQGWVLDAANYMFENYQTVTLRSLADHCGYSESYLCRKFKAGTGKTFSTIMREYRLDRAQKLLQETDLKLEDICESIGYSDTTQFIRDFKKKYGQTPGKYRKSFLYHQQKY